MVFLFTSLPIAMQFIYHLPDYGFVNENDTKREAPKKPTADTIHSHSVSVRLLSPSTLNYWAPTLLLQSCGISLVYATECYTLFEHYN